MENLRKVEFTLEQQKMSTMDYENPGEAEEKTKVRTGFFHVFGNEPFYSSEESRWIDRIVAIVEEEGSGKVFHVSPEFMKFVL